MLDELVDDSDPDVDTPNSIHDSKLPRASGNSGLETSMTGFV